MISDARTSRLATIALLTMCCARRFGGKHDDDRDRDRGKPPAAHRE
jgi:hypothetical protein